MEQVALDIERYIKDGEIKNSLFGKRDWIQIHLSAEISLLNFDDLESMYTRLELSDKMGDYTQEVFGFNQGRCRAVPFINFSLFFAEA